MIEVNKELSWEEMVAAYPGRTAFGKVLGRRKYNNFKLPTSMFITYVPEYGEELGDLRNKKFFNELGEYCDEYCIPITTTPGPGNPPYLGVRETMPNKENYNDNN